MPFLERGEQRLAYELFGTQGPPILAVQGAGCSGQTWRPQAEALAAEHQVVVFDNRGIGGSTRSAESLSIPLMAGDAWALAQHLGWSRFHVLGHSLGGVIAQQLALDHPEAVERLCLMCTGARGRDITRLRWQMLVLGVRTRVGTRSMRRRAALDMVCTRRFLDQQDCEALAQRWAPLFGRDLADNPSVILDQLRALAAYDGAAALAKLPPRPTLVLGADQDLVTPPELGQQLAAAIPGAQFELLRDAAHAIPLEDPERVSARLRMFFAP